MAKQVGRVNRVASQKWVILSGLKRRLGQLGCGSGRVGLTHIFHMNFFFFLNKENKMHLPSRKSRNKLLDVKCTILNSPLISRMNSVNLINTYLIILKLYKS